MTVEVRCQHCGRLLGVRLPSGEVEIRKAGKPLATVETGVLHCGRCWVGQEVAPKSWTAFRVLEGGGEE